MKFLRTILLLLTVSILFVPQSLKKARAPYLKVKSAFIHPVIPVQPSLFPRRREPMPDLSAKAIYILDLNSNKVLYEKNSKQSFYPASLTKIMTAIIAQDYYQKDQILTVKSADHSIGNTMSLKPGDSLTTTDLIYGLVVASGNDAALTLAENYPGGYSQFIVTMNQKAKELDLQKTHFNNTSGVEDVDHFSSARDLTILTQEALKNVAFRQAINTKQKEITSINGNKYNLISTNELLGVVSGVQGVKTGWTPEAGECLITLINRNNHPVIITVLGSEDRFGETKQIISWLYTNPTSTIHL